ncbi:hypothetical protein HMI46_03785 [Paenibacillus alvei]|uniref:Alanine racemase N-terminal domain-containing protein n=1 Tax=Paenibacillus alvei TaxID=44250 RepID=A0AAP6ZX17_PAEAL|nr:alanine racemase [Paenibacillus alvei]NEZ40858.1 hypothetical protein [Paenibacillus alvei]NOJ69672.1 hypothetical protein [Paenibacillus alvei]
MHPSRCFIQMNISGEESKYGLEPEQAAAFVEQLRAFPHIGPIGLMMMAPYEAEPEQTRPESANCKLRDELESSLSISLPHLSMGMSNDFEVAMEERATRLRLGFVLVGKEGET